jgi:hypothetical protein
MLLYFLTIGRFIGVSHETCVYSVRINEKKPGMMQPILWRNIDAQKEKGGSDGLSAL